MFRTTANKITLFRIALIPLFLLLCYAGRMTAALAVFVLASLSDAADGYVARRYKQSSTVGKFLDPLADKALVLSALCFFIENGQVRAWVVAAVIMRELAVSGLRLIAAERGKVIAAAWSGKVKTASTMLCICAMLLFGEHNIVNIISEIIIVTTTLFSGVHYFIVNKESFT